MGHRPTDAGTFEEVTLSDNHPARVRHLLLFELDDVPKDVPDDYTYTVKLLTGDSFEAYFDFTRERPRPAGNPEDWADGTPEFYAWREYLRQEEGRKHQLDKYDAYAAYVERVRDYIRANCLEPDDVKRIATAEDWRAIYFAAFANLVTQEDIAAAMRRNFRR